jgi:hypothetical protein
MNPTLPALVLVASSVLVSQVATRPGTAGIGEPVSQRLVAKSDSGEYRLDVAPIRGSYDRARYRLRRNGATVWSGDRDYTLRKAVVTDEGLVAGFAYSDVAGSQSLVILVLDAFGTEHWRSVKTRYLSPVPDGISMPCGIDLLVAHQPERALLRVLDNPADDQEVAFWSFRFDADGTATRFVLHPPSDIARNAGSLLKVCVIRGTSLLLCQWRTEHRLSPFVLESGTAFAVFNADIQEIWSLYLPHDYRKASDTETNWPLYREIQKDSAVLPGAARGEFILRFAEKNQAVSFRVERKGERWEVNEVRRRPYLAAPK